jgi:type IV secretion system protein VirB6
VRTLAHLDCQAQTIGSFGFQSLAERGSLAGRCWVRCCAVHRALRDPLLFGPGDEPRDLVNAVLKVGIVLTMAVSWPAWRTVAYDTCSMARRGRAARSPIDLPDPRDGFAQRLQTSTPDLPR